MQATVEQLHQQLQEILQQGDDERLREFLRDINSADVAEMWELLEDIDRSRVMFALDSRALAEVVITLDERLRDEVVDDLGGDRLVQLVRSLPPDDAADIVGELSQEESDRLLKRLSEKQSQQIEKLLKFGVDTAGGIMNPDVLYVPERFTVGQAIEHLRSAKPTDAELYYLYTTDTEGRLSGTLSPKRLITTSPKTLIADVAEKDPISVKADEDQEKLVQLLMKYDLIALPVVDENDILVGQVTVDDVMDVAAEEADEDIYHMAGTDAAELETTSIFRAWRIRFLWLIPSFLFLTGTAIAILLSKEHMPPELYAALAAFVPMIGALAGCCSVQTSAIIIRGLATGELAPTKLALVFGREGKIALIMAPACALLAWFLVWAAVPIMQSYGEISRQVDVFQIAQAVSSGMLAAVWTASLLGIMLPYLFRAMKIDPAIAAGPIVTASNDMLCVSIYLALAYWQAQPSP